MLVALSSLAGSVASSPRQAHAPHRAHVEVSFPSNVPHRRFWACSFWPQRICNPLWRSKLSCSRRPSVLSTRPLTPCTPLEAFWGERKLRWVCSPGRLPIHWFRLMLAKWARAKRAFMDVSLRTLGWARRSRLRSFKSCSSRVVMPPSVDEVRSDSHVISDVASPPSQALFFEKSCDVDVAVSLSPESKRHVVPIGVGVAKSDNRARRCRR
jgi:hypothetical protein